MSLLHAAQRIKRISRLPDEKEFRNTGEHTFELALLAWYICSSEKLPLNIEKVLKYALAHDIIEGYSGDTPIFDIEGQKTKAAREAAALLRIEEEFPEFQEFTETIHEYEKRDNPESKFVYALDKLIDPLDASMETTQSIWKDMNMSYTELRNYKDHKIAISPEIEPYWTELMEKITAKKEFFFHE
jgi:putative hydrolase of HD superfamily